MQGNTPFDKLKKAVIARKTSEVEALLSPTQGNTFTQAQLNDAFLLSLKHYAIGTADNKVGSIADLLLDKGAQINAVDKATGKTSLMIALEGSHPLEETNEELITKLLSDKKIKASIDQTSKKGKTALDLFTDKKNAPSAYVIHSSKAMENIEVMIQRNGAHTSRELATIRNQRERPVEREKIGIGQSRERHSAGETQVRFSFWQKGNINKEKNPTPTIHTTPRNTPKQK